MNLVSLIMQYLGPALVAKLASSLGINQGLVQKAIAAAIPTILAGLAGKTAQAGGARGLFDILSKQDPGLLGKLSNVIGGAQQKQIAEQGNTVLGSLLGNTSLGALTGALTRYADIGEGPAKGLLGVLAPVVLGSLAQQQKTMKLEPDGLAKLMADQKANIAKAIPGDFAKLLGGTGLLDQVMGKPADVNGAASAQPAMPAAAAKPVASTASTSASTQTTRASTFNWWPWLIAIALATALWWYLFQGRPQPVVSAPGVPHVMAGNTDVGSQLESSLKGLQGLLGSIKDEASARSALPKLQESQQTIDRLGGLANGLPADAKRALAGYAASWLPTLTPLITQLLGNSAVAPLVKPTLDAIRGRLEAMAKA